MMILWHVNPRLKISHDYYCQSMTQEVCNDGLH
jgi:hypothetical protein